MFENAIKAQEPIAWYRFRDGNFNNRIVDRSPNKRHLLKQIAAATRSAVPTRTTHPGGAYFPAVTRTAWSSTGTLYKGPTGVLNGAGAYTMVVSMRVVKGDTSADSHTLFGIGDDGQTPGISNSILDVEDVGSQHFLRSNHITDASGNISVDTNNTTVRVDDGVNRLYIVRYDDAASVYRMTISKPGYEALLEDTASTASGTGLRAANEELVINARQVTATGPDTFTGYVVDQIALFDTDIGATAEADLHSKWMTEVAGAGYYPSMMQFDGSTGYYNKTYTSAGNKVSGVLRFNRESFTAAEAGEDYETLLYVLGDNNLQRCVLIVPASDSAITNRQGKLSFQVQNTSGTVICRLISTVVVADGADHVLYFDFDGDDGTAAMVLDGSSVIDTGNPDYVAPTTGTLDTGASSEFYVGILGSVRFWGGEIGFFGHAETSGLDPDDFMDGNLPKPIDEKDWTEFGSNQPLVFAHDGDLENNKGSAGDFTKNGTITRTVGGSP